MSRSVIQLNRLNRRERDSLTETRTPRQLPLLRSECEDGPRPCPFLSCRYNLAADVSKAGNIQLSFMDELEGEEGPQKDVEERETCALDVAGRGPTSLEQIASMLGVTRERVRQIEAKALRKLSMERMMRSLRNED